MKAGFLPITSKAAQILFLQIGPGLFGVRTEDGSFSFEEEFKKKSEHEEVKAFELKLAQGAKKHAAVILTAKR
ncbi:hypothetical protein BsIDN1_12460 [Bacillus safensis]|uniref:Glutamate synthase domain-containing protein n=1 Tax=Bacillus safensis TaxID=561879 RepID=A0A5S9M4C5_BACIA|nr:hypothetical protein BsIDN1_12460 [Bacillus safensis]